MPRWPVQGRVYTLYSRCPDRWEPKRWVKGVGHVPKYGSKRGAVIATFSNYRELVAHAQALCRHIGIPASRWVDIFDWNV